MDISQLLSLLSQPQEAEAGMPGKLKTLQKISDDLVGYGKRVFDEGMAKRVAHTEFSPKLLEMQKELQESQDSVLAAYKYKMNQGENVDLSKLTEDIERAKSEVFQKYGDEAVSSGDVERGIKNMSAPVSEGAEETVTKTMNSVEPKYAYDGILDAIPGSVKKGAIGALIAAEPILETISSYTDAPSRAVLSAVAEGNNPISAAYKQAGAPTETAPTAKQITEQMGISKKKSPVQMGGGLGFLLSQLMSPQVAGETKPGKYKEMVNPVFNISPADIAEPAIEFGADWTNLVGLGTGKAAVLGAKKIPGMAKKASKELRLPIPGQSELKFGDNPAAALEVKRILEGQGRIPKGLYLMEDVQDVQKIDMAPEMSARERALLKMQEDDGANIEQMIKDAQKKKAKGEI